MRTVGPIVGLHHVVMGRVAPCVPLRLCVQVMDENSSPYLPASAKAAGVNLTAMSAIEVRRGRGKNCSGGWWAPGSVVRAGRVGLAPARMSTCLGVCKWANTKEAGEERLNAARALAQPKDDHRHRRPPG